MGKIIYANINKINFGLYDIESIFSALPPKELEKYEKFRFEADKKRQLAGKILLFTLLTEIGTEPESVDGLFEYNSRGKLFLPDLDCDFNISHAGDYAACGIIESGRIGIDIERKRDVHISEVGDIVFNEAEIDFLNAQNPDKVLDAFYRLWSSKEAYCKALGTGISGNIKDIYIDISGDNPLLRAACLEDTARWQFLSFSDIPGYSFEVCCEKGARDNGDIEFAEFI